MIHILKYTNNEDLPEEPPYRDLREFSLFRRK